MVSPKAEKPATAVTVNGLPNIEQLGGELNLDATTQSLRIQYLTRRFALATTAAALISELAFSGRPA